MTTKMGSSDVKEFLTKATFAYFTEAKVVQAKEKVNQLLEKVIIR